MKTTRKSLEDLFDEYADELRLAMKDDRSASMMNVIRQFLKDQGIEARPVADSPIGNLVASLPKFDDTDDPTLPN